MTVVWMPKSTSPGDGTVNAADYALWQTNFGATQPGSRTSRLAALPIPEPASIVLLVVMVIWRVAWRRD
mgnify:CR=1 FL=1